MGGGLLTNIYDGVARMTIDRPDSRNALTGEIMQAMVGFVLEVERSPDVKVLLVTGAGEHFAAGGDVKSFAGALDMSPEELRADFERRSREAAPLWLALARIPQPVVCAVRGYAAGAALSFIAGADYTIASDTAKFLLAHVGLGLVADAATTYHLPRAIGVRRAKELAFFGDRLDAQTALAWGLVNKVVPDAELERETEAVLARFNKAPAVSITQAKHLMNGSLGNSLEAQVALETAAVGECGASADIREGVKAFVEKRRPVFGQKVTP